MHNLSFTTYSTHYDGIILVIVPERCQGLHVEAHIVSLKLYRVYSWWSPAQLAKLYAACLAVAKFCVPATDSLATHSHEDNTTTLRTLSQSHIDNNIALIRILTRKTQSLFPCSRSPHNHFNAHHTIIVVHVHSKSTQSVTYTNKIIGSPHFINEDKGQVYNWSKMILTLTNFPKIENNIV